MAGGGGKRRNTDSGEVGISSYMQLRSRALLRTLPEKKRRLNSGEKDGNHGVESVLSRCSSDGSCDVAEIGGERSGRARQEEEEREGFESATCSLLLHEEERRREGTPTTEVRVESNMDSVKVKADNGRRTTSGGGTRTKRMPSETEIEEFFSWAEKEQTKKFAEKYNFDVVKEVPLQGRYEWIKLNP